jgi:aerobic C4-dicarboxylate transport protein
MSIRPLDTGAVKDYVGKAHDSSITGFLMNIIPTTLVSR